MRIDSEMLVAVAFAGLLIAFVLAQRRTFLATVDAKRQIFRDAVRLWSADSAVRKLFIGTL